MSINREVDAFTQGLTNRSKSKLVRLVRKCKEVEVLGSKIKLSREMS